ncbi:MAG: helix-hairpin-helix domain-containing protein [Cellvibrionaceae bacterium]|nr:helix-hairpin-helix domain-containing protein [Cellvibrionaceae bacterium]
MKNQITTFVQWCKPALLLALVSVIVLGFAHALSAAEAVAYEQPQAQTLVNINSASAEALVDGLTGIGPGKARAIIAWREHYGDFTHIEQLLEVKGIGEKTLDLNRSRIQF